MTAPERWHPAAPAVHFANRFKSSIAQGFQADTDQNLRLIFDLFIEVLAPKNPSDAAHKKLLGKAEFNFPSRSEWAKAHPSRCTAYLVSGVFAANGAIYFPSMFL
ncbi:hypothetical protein [Pseudorhodobacter wandonensis]|uniref:hypothetical protein n=1 Tax=Pseudorhodobacter wandonensis TaxID=1120568 RepID=UPI0012E14C24|nr:hypothetical protein [Pseudorhodobacter wandonensis]